jgi:hypothetical protein
VQQRHLPGQLPIDSVQPSAYLTEHRIARRLRRHAHEHTVSPEPSGQDLGRQQRGLSLALSHRRFDDQQPRARHPASHSHHQLLRRAWLLIEALLECLGHRASQPSPAAAQPELSPRFHRASPSSLRAHVGQVIDSGEVAFVAGDPVSHHYQAAELQLYGTAGHTLGLHACEIIESDQPGEHLYQRRLHPAPRQSLALRLTPRRPEPC